MCFMCVFTMELASEIIDNEDDDDDDNDRSLLNYMAVVARERDGDRPENF